MTNKPLCIYHGNCADGFGAAWVVRRFFKGECDFHPGIYGQEPPDVSGRHVIMVDFSYKRPVLEAMFKGGPTCAASILVLDHHKTAEEDLRGLPKPFGMGWQRHMDNVYQDRCEGLPQASFYALFDMDRSGAGLTWDFFFPDQPRPKLIDHIEDRDLWRFKLPRTRAIQAAVFSFPYEWEAWDALMDSGEEDLRDLAMEGEAIDRKMLKDIAELLGVATREMVIGGVKVPVVNLPYTMASEAAGKLAEGAPFAAAYFDRTDARVFSLRSRGDHGADVSAIAKSYGGGGHKNAAGFQMPIGWEGDQ